MKKNTQILFYMIAIFGMFILQSYSGGYTAANVAVNPSASSCAGSGCHSNAIDDSTHAYLQLLDANDNIISQYIPNTNYKVEVILKKTNGNLNNPKAGFQASILNASNTTAGTITSPSSLYIARDTIGGIELARQSSSNAGSFLSNDTVTWSFNWTAPAQGAGTLKLNVVANDANGNGNQGGDIIVYSSTQMNEASTVSTSEINPKPIKIYPNPSADNIHIKLPNEGDATITIYNNLGQLIINKQLTNQKSILDIRSVPTGNYFIIVNQGNTSWKKAFLKRD